MSTSGIVIAIGTSNSDPESLLYRYFKSKAIPESSKVLFDWKQVYKMKRYISEKHANIYKKIVENEIEEKGIHSTLIQTEWFCNFSLTNDRFTSLENLQENNILTEELEPNIRHYEDNGVYRVGSFDGAIKGDRSSFCLGTIDLRNNNYKVRLKEAFVIKEAGENANPDDLIIKVVDYCISNKLDYLIVDNTSNMEYLTIYLYEAMKKAGCKTQLIAFSFSGAREKVKMFSFFEALLFNQEYKMPKYEEIENSIGVKYLIEELCQLKREKTTRGEYTYKGINSNDFYDDFAMAAAMLGYSMKFLMDKIKEGNDVDIGRIKYRLYLKKWTEEKEKPKKLPPRYMTIL